MLTESITIRISKKLRKDLEQEAKKARRKTTELARLIIEEKLYAKRT